MDNGDSIQGKLERRLCNAPFANTLLNSNMYLYKSGAFSVKSIMVVVSSYESTFLFAEEK